MPALVSIPKLKFNNYQSGYYNLQKSMDLIPLLGSFRKVEHGHRNHQLLHKWSGARKRTKTRCALVVTVGDGP